MSNPQDVAAYKRSLGSVIFDLILLGFCAFGFAVGCALLILGIYAGVVFLAVTLGYGAMVVLILEADLKLYRTRKARLTPPTK